MAIADSDSEEEEVREKMESDVKHMALKVSDYRKSLADNLKNTFDSAISSRRLDLFIIDSESEEAVVLRAGAHLGTEDQESRHRYVQLKEAVCANVATMPLVVKRMRVCKESIKISKSLNGTIHPAFTRRKGN